MIARALPLTACLIWLACESHFSMSFFVTTVQSGMASIADGLATVMVAEYPSAIRTASVTE
ncbi:MAG: hypothetical protein WBP94_12170 [Rhodomicrobiaceae bacterium]